MPLDRRHLCCAVAIVGLFCPSANAKVIADGSLGPRSSLPGPAFAIPHTLGQQRGGNLFHSFERFNLKPNQSATFTGPGGVVNILARVTGGQRSKIRGAIRSDIPGANLFLINSAGIEFGDGASLDLSGSFAVTTADVIRLGAGPGVFPADPSVAATLTSSPPAAFGFLKLTGPPVAVRTTELAVDPGKSISIVSIGATLRQATLSAPGGTISIAGGPLVSFKASRPTADSPAGAIDLSDDAVLITDDDGSAGGGSITLLADSLRMRRSFVVAQSFGPDDGGSIRIEADDSLVLNTGFIATGSFGAGAGGDIRVNTGLLRLAGNEFGNPGGIVTQTGPDGGRAGALNVTADQIQLRRGGEIRSQTSGPNRAGDVNVVASQMAITDGGFIGSGTSADGAGADVVVRADRLELSGRGTVPTGIFSNTTARSPGRGGSIDIQAESLRVLDLAVISTTTMGAGRGGTISVRADDILLDGADQRAFTGLAANTQAKRNAGDGGRIDMDTETLTIRSGAGVAARSRGPGRPGDIRINARDEIIIDGQQQLAGITTETSPRILADGGNIFVRAGGDISIISGQINAETSRDRGNIEVVSGGNLLLSGSGEITARAGGAGGQIDIASDFTVLRDASVINGIAGGVDVLVSIESRSLLLDYNSAILTDRPAFSIDDTVGQSIAGLRVSLADPNLRLSEVCARIVESTSSFVATSRGALPMTPGGSAAAIELRWE